MRVVREQKFSLIFITVFDGDPEVKVAESVMMRSGDVATVRSINVVEGARGRGHGQTLVDAIRDELGDIGDPDLSFELDEDGVFRCGGVRAKLTPNGAAFLRTAMSETKRRRDQRG